jgi:hypothetical protein
MTGGGQLASNGKRRPTLNLVRQGRGRVRFGDDVDG